MKALQVLCLAAAASVAFASVASAATVSPAGGSFTAKGTTNLVKGGATLGCTATFNGTTDASGTFALVNSASFSGGPLGSCAFVSATNLPWKITAPSTTSVIVQGVAVNTPIGNCDPTDLNGGWANGSPSTMSFTSQPLAPDCSVSGNLKVPGVTLVP